MEDSSTPALVLFEPKWEKGGHHPSWFKELVGRLLSLDQNVVALCPQPEELVESVSSWLSTEKVERLTAVRIPDQRQMLGTLGKTPFRMFRALTMAREYNRHIVQATENLTPAPECVWFGLTDLFALRVRGFGKWVSRMFVLPYTGLFFFPPHPPQSFVYRILFDDLGFFRGRNCRGIVVLSDRDRLRLLQQYSKPVWTVPDFHAGDHEPHAFSKNSSLASEIRELSCGRKIVLMAGDISPRKGLVQFLKLAEYSRALDYLFVVAGTLHEDAFTKPDQREIMRARSFSNVHIHPHRIASDNEFGSVVYEADILYAVYPDFDHSSNMLIQSAVNETPIMVASNKEMGLRVDEYQLGATVEPDNVIAMKQALVRLTDDEFSNTKSFKAGCRAYRDLHSADVFAREVLRICTTSHSSR
ncbi:hypothetical protein ACFL1V_04475 [Pseudomonadota bacterium]